MSRSSHLQPIANNHGRASHRRGRTMPIHDRKLLIREQANGDECLRDETDLLAPMWYPDFETIKRSNIMAAMRGMSFDSYEQFHSWSVRSR